MTRREWRQRTRDRLRVALQELESGGTYANAAYTAGYADESHFSRLCVQTLGARPRAALNLNWRERLAA